MKNWIKTMSAIVLLAFASNAWAQSSPMSLGYISDGTAEANIDYLSTAVGSVSLYCDGDLVFQFDVGGVTYAASGVSYTENAPGYYSLEYLPVGNYTATLAVQGSGTYSYSQSNDWIHWVSSSGSWYYCYVSFIV